MLFVIFLPLLALDLVAGFPVGRELSPISSSSSPDMERPSREKLPFPDLPEGVRLKISDLEALPHIPKLDPKSRESRLTPSNWMALACNLNMFSGRFLKNLKAASHNFVLLPKNKNLEPIFQRSKVSEVFESRVVSSSSMIDTLLMSEVGASMSVQSPFVSGSASFKYSEEDRKIPKKKTIYSLVKYQLPIGWFDFSDTRTYIDNGDNSEKANSTFFQLNPILVLRFRELLDRFDKVTAGTSSDLHLAKDVANFFSQWGSMIPLSVRFGLASYRTSSFETTTEQTLSKHSRSLQAAVVAAVLDSFTSGVGMATFDPEKSETLGWKQVKITSWAMLGGCIMNPRNPFTLFEYRTNPNCWSAIKYKNYVSIISLLPKVLQDRLIAYKNNAQFMSTFHQLEDN